MAEDHSIQLHSPISRLPWDIVKLIFEEYHKLNCSHRLLGQVCRTWYDLTIQTASLWSHIIIQAPSVYLPPRYPSRLDYGRSEFCSSLKDLDRVLIRSGGVAITVQIPNYSLLVISARGPPMLERILSMDVARRVLSLDLNSYADEPPLIEIPSGIKFSALRDLKIAGGILETNQIVRSIANINASPNLKVLRILNNLDRTYDWRNSSLLPHLEQLTITACESSKHEEIIRRSQSLRSLTIQFAIWPSLDTSPACYTKLQTLSANCHQLRAFTYLDLPALQNLELTCISIPRIDDITVAPEYTVTFPELRILTITLEPLSLLAAFRVPKLEELRVSSVSSVVRKDGEPLHLLSNVPPFSFVRIFHLQSWASGNEIMQALNNFPAIEELKIKPAKGRASIRYDGQFFERLGRKQDGEIFLPRLRDLIFGNVREGRNCPGPTQIEELIARRRGLGVPIKIHIPES